jgi:hypothetical protein
LRLIGYFLLKMITLLSQGIVQKHNWFACQRDLAAGLKSLRKPDSSCSLDIP